MAIAKFKVGDILTDKKSAKHTALPGENLYLVKEVTTGGSYLINYIRCKVDTPGVNWKDTYFSFDIVETACKLTIGQILKKL